MKRTRIVSIRLTDDEYDKVSKLAELRGVRVSDVLRQIINTPPTLNYKHYYPNTVTTTTADVNYFRWNEGVANV